MLYLERIVTFLEGVSAMEKSEKVMEEFLKKLDHGDFKKENLPNTGNEINKAYVAQQVSDYEKFLKSGAGEEIRKL